MTPRHKREEPGRPGTVEGELRSPWRKALIALEVVAAVSTILAVFVRDLFGLQGPRWAEILVVWLGLSLAGVFLTLVLVQWSSGRLLHRARSKYQRRARFAEAAGSLSEAHRHISDAIHHVKQDERYADSFHTGLTALARAYSIVAGADCRATVKRLGYDGEEPEIRDFYVRTFGREIRRRAAPSTIARWTG